MHNPQTVESGLTWSRPRALPARRSIGAPRRDPRLTESISTRKSRRCDIPVGTIPLRPRTAVRRLARGIGQPPRLA
jgi:hypothetical protein